MMGPMFEDMIYYGLSGILYVSLVSLLSTWIKISEAHWYGAELRTSHSR